MNLKAAPTARPQPSKVSSVLVKARQILDKPDAWIKGQLTGHNGGNIPTTSLSDVRTREFLAEADVVCLVGAVHKACVELDLIDNDLLDRSMLLLSRTVALHHKTCAIFFNDDPETTHDDVLDVLDLAIHKADDISD